MNGSEPNAFPWEDKAPEHLGAGFKVCGGPLTVHLSYGVFSKAVLLMAHVEVAGKPLQLWRRFWAPKESAVDAANQLAADAERYLTEHLHLVLRPNEDLDLEDFVEHLHKRLNHELH